MAVFNLSCPDLININQHWQSTLNLLSVRFEKEQDRTAVKQALISCYQLASGCNSVYETCFIATLQKLQHNNFENWEKLEQIKNLEYTIKLRSGSIIREVIMMYQQRKINEKQQEQRKINEKQQEQRLQFEHEFCDKLSTLKSVYIVMLIETYDPYNIDSIRCWCGYEQFI